MNGTQISVIAIVLGLFLLLYFGFDNKPKEYKAIEKSRALTVKATDSNTILQEAFVSLNNEQKQTVRRFEEMADNAPDETSKLAVLKELAGYWYSIGNQAVSGIYAEEIANIVDDDTSWSIAGTTYAAGFQNTKEETIKAYCNDKAIEAFENAISLNSKSVQHKVNLALRHVESQQPMKGILDLRALNEKYPENVMVLNNLGQLAIRSNQFEKAKERFEKVLTLEPTNEKATCWLAQVFEQMNETAKAAAFKNKCEALSVAQ